MASACPFLTAEWRDLAMVNYEIDPAVLAPLVPRATELDAGDGRTLASIVGFRFLDTRVLGVAIPGHRDFEELNLRFYVRRRSDGGWRRGVVFVKEIVPRRAIAWVARVLYNENYVAAAMRHDVRREPNGGPSVRSATYEWRHANRWNRVSVECGGAPYVPADHSEETFITEHYWGYARQRDGGTVEYQVEHPRWQVLRSTSAVLDCDVAALYGPAFAPFLSAPPRSAFVAIGSAVTVRAGLRV
jgi:uncharacterized protein YqjF (DUF2071 family)